MRITGSLFTFNELSASIKEGRFATQSGAILTNSSYCMTVSASSAMVKIVPILGASSRYPFYHELQPSGSVSGSVQTVTYSYTNVSGGSGAITTLTKKDPSNNYTGIVTLAAPISSTTVNIDAGDEIYGYMDPNGNTSMTVDVYLNSSYSATYTTYVTGDSGAYFGPLTVSVNDAYEFLFYCNGVA